MPSPNDYDFNLFRAILEKAYLYVLNGFNQRFAKVYFVKNTKEINSSKPIAIDLLLSMF